MIVYKLANVLEFENVKVDEVVGSWGLAGLDVHRVEQRSKDWQIQTKYIYIQ